MASKPILSIIFLHITLLSPPSVVSQCTYPCYTPPTTGGDNTPPVTTLPPPSQTGIPPPAAIYTPPTNVFPYNPPTPASYGGAPPAPDPIVPWFPFYYKDPPRNPHKSSSAHALSGSMLVISLVHLLMFQLVLC